MGARGRSRLSPAAAARGDRVRNRPAPGPTGRRCTCVETSPGDSARPLRVPAQDGVRPAGARDLRGHGRGHDRRPAGPPRPGSAGIGLPVRGQPGSDAQRGRAVAGPAGPGERGDADGPARGLERALGHRAGDRRRPGPAQRARPLAPRAAGPRGGRQGDVVPLLRSPRVPHGDPDLRPADPTRVLRSHPGAWVEARAPDAALYFARDGKADPQALPLASVA